MKILSRLALASDESLSNEIKVKKILETLPFNPAIKDLEELYPNQGEFGTIWENPGDKIKFDDRGLSYGKNWVVFTGNGRVKVHLDRFERGGVYSTGKITYQKINGDKIYLNFDLDNKTLPASSVELILFK